MVGPEVFCLFRAEPMAMEGSSQASGPTGAVASVVHVGGDGGSRGGEKRSLDLNVCGNCFFFFFLLCRWHIEAPEPGIKPVPHQ